MMELFSSCPVCTVLFLNNMVVAFISLLDLFPYLYWVRQFGAGGGGGGGAGAAAAAAAAAGGGGCGSSGCGGGSCGGGG